MSAEEIVFNDPNLLGLVLGWLNRDKHIALYICLMVNHLFHNVVRNFIKPRYNPLGAWLRYYCSVPERNSKNMQLIRQIAKNHIICNSPSVVLGLLSYYCYYGCYEGVRKRLEILSEENALKEMSTNIPNKYSAADFNGIFEIIAHNGSFECFVAIWEWYLKSKYSKEDEEWDGSDLTAYSMGLWYICNYGRLEMVDEASRYDCKATELLSFEFEDIFGDRSEYYDRRWDTSEARDLRVFEMLRIYGILESDRNYLQVPDYNGLMSWSLISYNTYSQHRTLAIKAWEWGARITAEVYFEEIVNHWKYVDHYSEEKIIDDIKFALSLILREYTIAASDVSKIIEKARENSWFKLVEFLQTLV